MSKTSPKPKQKVLFELEKADHHDFSAETIWTESLGNDRHRLLNIPLYVYGASFGDIVFARDLDEEFGFPIVEQVVVRSGHSTYRLFVSASAENNPLFDECWKPIEDQGCSFEGQAGNKMLGIDVPPSADIHGVYRLLEIGEEAGAWGFEEGNCAHQV